MKTITVDELALILKWAVAYTDCSNQPIEHNLLSCEEEALKAKLKTLSSSFILGMLNASFLLGFKQAEGSHPCQELVAACKLDDVGRPGAAEVNARRALLKFLREGGLIA